MNKLFLFAIGGTGERVVNSLVMLLAAGMETKSEIIPVFFDTDIDSKALDRAITIIDRYVKIHKQLTRFDHYSMPFFNTAIPSVEKMVVDGGQVETLHDLIDEINLLQAGKDELKLLFSDKNLEMPLNMGFIGNPNIGSVALNYLLEGRSYTDIQSRIHDGDKIFIISSIFGGTGAAGFPLLLNKLRNDKNIGGKDSKITVGGATILPYFEFIHQQANGTPLLDEYKENIDSGTFTAKTKAALMYYDAYIKDNGLSSLYYLGDDKQRSVYKKVLGGIHQDNPANFIELLTALSILHFDKNAKPFSETNRTNFYNYALMLSQDSKNLNLNSISSKDYDLKTALVSFHLFKLIWEKFLENYINMQATWAVKSGFDSNKYQHHHLSETLKSFFISYQEWKDELNNINHGRRFNYYNDTQNTFNEKTITEHFSPDISKKVKHKFWEKEKYTIDPCILNSMNKVEGKSKDGDYSEDESVVFAMYCISEAVKLIIKEKKVIIK